MKNERTHAHACQDCGVDAPCSGERSRNYDGCPEVICSNFHLPLGVTNPDFVCRSCGKKRDDRVYDEVVIVAGRSPEASGWPANYQSAFFWPKNHKSPQAEVQAVSVKLLASIGPGAAFDVPPISFDSRGVSAQRIESEGTQHVGNDVFVVWLVYFAPQHARFRCRVDAFYNRQ